MSKDLLFAAGAVKEMENQMRKNMMETIFKEWKAVKIPPSKRRKIRKFLMLLCIKGKVKNPKKHVEIIMNACEKGMTKEMGKLMGVPPDVIEAHVQQ